MNVANKSVDEKYADVIVSTAHKSKGREWSSVKIATDFREPVNEDGTPSDPIKAECNLAYVSVTRAKNQLDRGGLAWVDNYIDNSPGREEHPEGISESRESAESRSRHEPHRLSVHAVTHRPDRRCAGEGHYHHRCRSNP